MYGVGNCRIFAVSLATAYSTSWLEDQDLNYIEVDGYLANEMRLLFQSSRTAEHRITALLLCVGKPAVAWLVKKYWEELLERNGQLPKFRDPNERSTLEANKAWVEEVIFGGKLLLEGTQVIFLLANLAESANIP